MNKNEKQSQIQTQTHRYKKTAKGYIDTTEYDPITGRRLIKESHFHIEEKPSYEDLSRRVSKLEDLINKYIDKYGEL